MTDEETSVGGERRGEENAFVAVISNTVFHYISTIPRIHLQSASKTQKMEKNVKIEAVLLIFRAAVGNYAQALL